MSIAARQPSRLAGPVRIPRAPVIAAIVIVAWLAAGIAGLVLYVDHYWLYRGFPPPKAAPGVAHGTVHTMPLWSPALGQQRSALVYLPPGYRRAAARGTRFPVLYLLHGHPGHARVFFLAGSLGPVADTLIGRHRIRPMIIVLPDGASHHNGQSDEWANGRFGRYEGFLLDLVHTVDRRYATLARGSGRVIGGLSEGGFGAANVALHHPGMFAGFQSWSGYFRETPSGTFAGATPAQIFANSPADYVPTIAPRIRRSGLNAFIYVGSSDHVGLPLAREFAGELAAAGAHVRSGVYPGGHDWGLWRAQLPHMLEVASSWLGGGRA